MTLRPEPYDAPLPGAGSPMRAVAVWLMAIAACATALIAYDLTPNFNEDLLANSEDKAVHAMPSSTLPTIHFALHPHCPCTRISLKELAQIVAQSMHPVRVNFWVYIPSGTPASWADGRSVEIVKAFPNSKLIMDVDGRKARELGITTSGGVVAFDRMGNFAFSGGVQASRGMAGGSLGAKTLQEIIAGREIDGTIRTPVYGCSLVSPRATHGTEESYR